MASGQQEGSPERASILLQDSATAERQAVRACLTSLGAPIVEVSTGSAALEYLREHHDCAVAILDATSLEAIDVLESRLAEEPDLAVIFLSDEQRAEARDLLARRPGGFFARPVDLEALRSRVSALVKLYREHHRLRRENARLSRSERAVREESDRERAWLHSFLAQTPAVIARLAGPQHVFEYVNPRYLQTIGNASRNPVGLPARAALPELEGQPFFAQLDEAYFTGQPQHASQIRVLIRRGREAAPEEAFFNFSYQPTRDRSGRVDGVLIHGSDVTALVKSRRAVELLSEQLRASELRLRVLAEAIPQKVFTALPDGSLEYANSRLLDETGRTLAELQRDGWVPCVQTEDALPCKRAWSHSLATGEHFEMEVRLVRIQDGAARWHLCRAVADRDDEGRVLRWYGTLTDVHDQKRAEREAEELASFQQKLLAVVGHDLRTPLTSILATAQLLLQPGGDDPEQRERGLLRIARSGLRMKRMIDDLVGFTRARLGHGLNLVSEPCHLAELCEQVIDEVVAVHPERRIRLDVQDPGAILGDSSRLAQVVSNLLSNAAQYAPAGTSIEVGLARDGGHVVLTVTNQGAPIPSRKLKTIFQPFKRGGRDRGGAHLGLGLFIVEQVIHAHGGTVEVDSDASSGTRFTVRLPALAEGA